MDTFKAILLGQPGMMPKNKLDINFNNLYLVTPCAEYMSSFKEAINEYMAHRVEEFSYPKLSTQKDEKAYLKRIKGYAQGKVPEGFVPSSAFWLVDGQHYLGSGDVRHHLNDNLRRFGGNIGYSIRPGAWGLGLGTINLALLIKEAKTLGVAEPLITCYETNIGSIKIIEKNGGTHIDTVQNRVKAILTPTRIYQIFEN